MLDQVIYTRCKPARELKNKGRVNYQSDGYGVFSFSKELFEDARIIDYEKFVNHISKQNASKEGNKEFGLFNSYEYGDAYALTHYISFEYSRPLCTELRKDGLGHRPGNFIKQIFIGDLKGYPAEWFGAEAFDAYKKNDNFYYIDGESPLYPQVNDTPKGGYINRDKVRTFVKDGRAEAVKAAVWFIIHEYEKPVGERRVLIIRDYPENVEFWVAAIGYAFTSSMAQEITFTTNKTGIYRNMESGLFLFTDECGKYCELVDAKNRTPYNMIVGYHPKDAPFSIFPTSPFVLIDGATKTANFETDSSINLPYYADAVKYESDIEGFTTTVLPKLSHVKISSEIPRIYDAYKYLLDAENNPERWDFRKSYDYLSIFDKYGLRSNSVLCGYLADRFIKTYPRFASDDRKGGYSLLRIVYEIARLSGKEAEVKNAVSSVVSADFGKVTSGDTSLVETWNGLKKAGLDSLAVSACDICLSDDNLPSLEKCLSPSKLSLSVTLVDIFMDVLKRHGGVQAIVMSDVKKSFVSKAVAAVENDSECFGKLMSYLKASGSDFIRLSVANIKRLDSTDPSRSDKWEEEMLKASNGNICVLFEKIRETGDVDISWIEDKLTNRLVTKGTSEGELLLAFRKSIDYFDSDDPNVGKNFFSTWIGMGKKSTFDEIIKNIKSFDLDKNLQKELFRKMDGVVDYNDVIVANGFNMMTEYASWAKSLGENSAYLPFAAFWQRFKKALGPEDVTDAVAKLAEAAPSAECSMAFLKSRFFASITDKIASTKELWNANVHIGILGMFKGYDGNTSRSIYIGRYLNNLITKVDSDDSRHLPKLLLSIWQITMTNGTPDEELRSLCESKIRSYAGDPKKVKELSRGIKKVDTRDREEMEDVKESLYLFLNPSLNEKDDRKNKKKEKEIDGKDKEGKEKVKEKSIFSWLFGKKKKGNEE